MLKPGSAQPEHSYTDGRLHTFRRTSSTPLPTAALSYRASEDLLALRRLRYHLLLLESGYRQALHPAFQVPSQRAERIALGIDRPELDTIPLWSARRPDGAIGIPFVETVLRAIHRDLEAGARAVAMVYPGAGPRFRQGRRFVGNLLRTIAGQRRRCAGGPGEDLFLPGHHLKAVFGSEGPLWMLRRDGTAADDRSSRERN